MRQDKQDRSAEPATLQLIAATTNAAKVRELSRVVGGVATVVPPPSDLTPPPEREAIESGSIQAAFARIAAQKAASWSDALGGDWTIASDGGLLVPGLGAKWDPLRTRRFAGSQASDRERAERLLKMARGLGGAERRIGWIEAVAIARGGRVVAAFIVEDPPGVLAETLPADWSAEAHGFWIPQVWLCPEVGGKRLTELSDEERAGRRDHWDRLAALVQPFLRGYGEFRSDSRSRG